MKNIILIFFLVVTGLQVTTMNTQAQSADLTAEMLGLPQELFDATKNLCTTTRHTGFFECKTQKVKKAAAVIKAENDAYKLALREARAKGLPKPPIPDQYEWKTTFAKKSTDVPYGSFVLNRIHDLIWVFGYEYEGIQNGKHVLHKYHGDWLSGDQNRYYNFDSYFYIYQLNGKWVFSGDNEEAKFRYKVPNDSAKYTDSKGQIIIPDKWVIFSAQDIALATGMTTDQVLAWDVDYDVCEVRNPATYMTSVFPRFSSDGTAYLYISGKRSDLVKFNSLIYTTGGYKQDYDIQMIAINSCEIPEVKTSDTDWTGDGGRCDAEWFETLEEARSYDYAFDLGKKWSVMICAFEISSSAGWPNGHYERFHAYFDVEHGRIMQSTSDYN